MAHLHTLYFLLALLAFCTEAIANSAPPSLVYFDARGSAEVSRIICKIGGLDFIDRRLSIVEKEGGGFDTPEFQKMKENGELACNMQRAPMLILPSGVVIGQSKTIERYLAKKCSMLGKDDEEQALIDCVCENIRDIRDKFGKIRMTGGMSDNQEKETALTKWYREGEMKDWIVKLEQSLPSNPTHPNFAVGDRLSHADILIWNLMREVFEDREAVDAVIEKDAPRIRTICQHVSALPSLQKWLQERPLTRF